MLKKDNSKDSIRRQITHILRKHKLKCSLIHDPLVLPYSLSLFLNIWAIEPSNNNFQDVVDYFDSKPSSCLEATIEKALTFLSN
jgi:hypothetical protein